MRRALSLLLVGAVAYVAVVVRHDVRIVVLVLAAAVAMARVALGPERAACS